MGGTTITGGGGSTRQGWRRHGRKGAARTGKSAIKITESLWILSTL